MVLGALLAVGVVCEEREDHGRYGLWMSHQDLG